MLRPKTKIIIVIQHKCFKNPTSCLFNFISLLFESVSMLGISWGYHRCTHVFKILCEIDPLYEYYGHLYHVIGKIKNTGDTVLV